MSNDPNNKLFYKNKRILVTGACGTVGSEIIDQLLNFYSPSEVLAMDNNESEIFFLEQKYIKKDNLTVFLGDIRDRDKLCRRTKGVDIILHAAAFKHVILCERSPFEAVQTNIIGVQNVIYAAHENSVKHVLFTSSDKAVNPTNVMGTTKLMGERLISAANIPSSNNSPIFASTRFGNVLGSRGSVLPIFKNQIKQGLDVTITDEEMTRFVMTTEESVKVVLGSLPLAKGGEVFITKMPVVRIIDLAHVLISELAPEFGHSPDNIKVKNIGSKPGEKLYEELMSGEEIRRTKELNDYFVILPAFINLYKKNSFNYPSIVNETVTKPYVSTEEPCMTREELKVYLRENDLLAI